MRFTEFSAQSQANGDSDGLVVQTETARSDRQSLQPVAAMRGGSGEYSGFLVFVKSVGLKLCDVAGDRLFVPCVLLVGVSSNRVRVRIGVVPGVDH